MKLVNESQNRIKIKKKLSTTYGQKKRVNATFIGCNRRNSHIETSFCQGLASCNFTEKFSFGFRSAAYIFGHQY